MYSLILATALTAGGEATNWGCWGCHGGGGGGFIGISYGYSVNIGFGGRGCWGCHGCWGSCNGCWGSGYGCSGCWGSGYGCSGCWGGWSPSYSYNCCGCCGGSYSGWGGYCYGGYGCCGGGVIIDPYQPPPRGSGSVGSGSEVSSRGTVTVRLPADAKLYIDGQFANLSSSTRTFVTPDLEKGRDYAYTLKAEWTRDGKVVSDSQRVVVKAGKMSSVEFKDATTTSAQTESAPVAKDSPAKVTVRLPAAAKLYIDGQLCPLTSDVRTFNTPALTAGKKFYYTLEVVRDGGKKDSRQVILEAGKTVDVDFNKTVVVNAND